MEDISERKHWQDELLRSKEEWERTFDSVPDLIAILDANHRIMRVNRAMADRIGRRTDECTGKACYEIIHGTNKVPHFCPHNLTLLDHNEHDVEVHEESLGGHFLVSTTPLLDKEGHMMGTVHVARDITERKRAEEALRKTADDLARSNADLERFAYVASHDLQEPLRSIRSYVQLLERRYKGRLDNDADEFIRFVVDGAGRMQTLILDLLAYSRVGSQGHPLIPTSSEEALQDALDSLKDSIAQSTATITYGPLPMVRGDKIQISQLFQNLIGNAIKFQREGVKPEIHVSAKEEDNQCVFSVRDNGIGIDSRYHEKVFTIFQRLHTIEKYSGTGIGLAICKRIVERHGGEIRLESKPEEGSVFVFTLPKP